MRFIPTRPTPSQVLTVTLNGQPCRLRIYQMVTGLFMDVYVNDALIIAGVVCQNANRIVRSAYLGFIGDLAWFDQQGVEDPTYDGLGTRFRLGYIEP